MTSKGFASLLLPLHSFAGSSQLIFEVAKLAAQLHAKLHLVRADRGSFERETLRGIETYKCDLLVISLGQVLASAARAMIQTSPIPVMLIPLEYRGDLTWTSILVPMSGELHINRALELALDVANELGIPVDLMHALDPRSGQHCPLRRFTDHAHHEYPRMVDEFISRASPLSTAEEKRRIRSFRFCDGESGAEIAEQVRIRETGLVTMEWHGRFLPGHARVLKKVLREIPRPILLVKPRRGLGIRLKFGAD